MTDTADPREAAVPCPSCGGSGRNCPTCHGWGVVGPHRLCPECSTLATEPSAGVTSEAADRYPPYPAAPVLGGLPDSSPLSGAGSGDTPSTSTETPRPRCSDCSCCTATKVFGVCGACSVNEECENCGIDGPNPPETPTRVVGGGETPFSDAELSELRAIWEPERPDSDGLAGGYARLMVLRFLATLATTPVPPVSDEGLDVERLARALHIDMSTCLYPASHREADHRAHLAQAKVIAAEYRALSSEPVR